MGGYFEGKQEKIVSFLEKEDKRGFEVLCLTEVESHHAIGIKTIKISLVR